MSPTNPMTQLILTAAQQEHWCHSCNHPEQAHGIPHLHAPYTERCPDACCVVDACDCDTFRSIADAAEHQGMARLADMANGG